MSDSFATPQTVDHQAALSMGFPKQDYWSGLPFPSPGDIPNPAIKPAFPALVEGFFTSKEAQYIGYIMYTHTHTHTHTHTQLTPILWPPDVKSQLIRKNPDAGKDRRQEEKGTTEDELVG